MSKFGSKRPSPALVISILALFVALGGSAYAATKIGTKDIKANAITAGKIKKNAVTTAKIKKEAVTGAKIKESSLGAVPSATNATNAANWSRAFSTGIVKANIGQTVQLASAAPFTFYGSCKDLGAGKYEARTYATTSAPNSLISSYTDYEWQEFDFKPGEDAELGEKVEGTTPYWGWDEYSYDTEWTAIDPTGTMLLYGGAVNGIHVLGAACSFNLWWFNHAA